MRNIKLFVTFLMISAGLFLSSCLGGDSQKELNVAPGIRIHTHVHYTNVAALDPMFISLRFNTLMAEAKNQSETPTPTPATTTDLTKVMITIDGKQVNLYNYLFGTAKLTIVEAGLYKITYNTEIIPAKDVMRKGVVIIDTNGDKLLNELSATESWRLYRGNTEVEEMYMRSFSAGGGDALAIKLPARDLIGERQYVIKGTGMNNVWDINILGFETYIYEDTKSDWNASFNLTYTPKPVITPSKSTSNLAGEALLSMGFDEMNTAHLTLSGSADGQTLPWFYTFKDVSYDIWKDLEIDMACGIGSVDGEERMVVEGLPIEHFPSKTVTIIWKKQETSGDKKCKGFFTLRYNGWEYSEAEGVQKPIS